MGITCFYTQDIWKMTMMDVVVTNPAAAPKLIVEENDTRLLIYNARQFLSQRIFHWRNISDAGKFVYVSKCYYGISSILYLCM